MFIELPTSIINSFLIASAIISVESNGNPNAIGDNGYAVGVMQIHPIMVKDVNRILKEERYNLEDRYSVTKSIEMFMIYTDYYTPSWDAELVAKCWNGGSNGHKKSATEKYWLKVKGKFK